MLLGYAAGQNGPAWHDIEPYGEIGGLEAAAVGRVATALFLRTHARGERVYLAMLSRGYTGAIRSLVPGL